MAENTNTERDYPPLPLTKSQYGFNDTVAFTADDMYAYVDADRAARASLSLPAAGQEPVATVYTMEALAPGGGVKYHATIHKPVPAGTRLYAAPQPAVAAGWLPIESSPRHTKEMFVVRAFDVLINGHKYTSDPYCVWADKAEFVRWPHPFEPTHWMRIPPAPSTEGESNG